MAEISSLANIPDISFVVPDDILINQDAVKYLDKAALAANQHHMAIVYHCMNCKSVLNHVIGGKAILRCNHCSKTWFMG